MQDFPKWFNTKEDILNVLTDYPEQTKEYLVKLLTDRFIWTEDNGVFTMSEDPQARLFVLGFTVREVLEITGDVEIIPNRPSALYMWDETTKTWVPDTKAINEIKKQAIIDDYEVKFDELKSAYLAKIGNGTANETTYKADYAALKTALINELNNVGV